MMKIDRYSVEYLLLLSNKLKSHIQNKENTVCGKHCLRSNTENKRGKNLKIHLKKKSFKCEMCKTLHSELMI